MKPSNRIIVNTFVQYVRSIMYILLTLFSTRYVLAALGHSGYGVYVVMGSFVSMISFLTQSLATSTQRFLSYSHGLHDKNKLKEIFANALCLHFVVACFLGLLLLIIKPHVLNYLNIPIEYSQSVGFVYYMVVIMVLLSFITSPIRALYIARENIIYVSLVEVLDAVLKLSGAIVLPFIQYDSLRLYALLLLGIALVNFLCFYTYACWQYEECTLPKPYLLSKEIMKKLLGFACWNIYSVGATIIRVQGLAMILNKFSGTLVNAAYGIAQQVSNAAGFIVLSVINAVNPQLMKAEGEGNRTRMWELSTMQSRYAFLVLSILCIPMLWEMDSILIFWLKDIPAYAITFCRFFLVAFMIDQLTIGLSSANQAIGKIRDYSLLLSTIRLITLPIAWYCMHKGYSPTSLMIVYISIESIVGIIRLPYLHYTAGLAVKKYLSVVCLRSVLPILGTILISWGMTTMPHHPLRFILTEILSVSMGCLLVFKFSLFPAERDWVRSKGLIFIKKVKYKI